MKRPCMCDKAQCRLCALYHHDPAYRTLWDDQGQEPNPQTSPGRFLVKRPLPCVHLGPVLLRRSCNCRRDDVHTCSVGHGKISQNGYCEICPDYQLVEE